MRMRRAYDDSLTIRASPLGAAGRCLEWPGTAFCTARHLGGAGRTCSRPRRWMVMYSAVVPRMARILAAAALGAGPALVAGAAYAEPEATPAVEFSGGSVLNMLVCKSQPSTSRLSVPAESRITFVNRLGQNATLRVGGKTVTSVGANQAVPVVFHQGPVEVSMTISCSAGVVEEFRPVTIGVTPKPAAAPPAAAPTPPPANRAPSPTATSTRGNGSGYNNRSATPAPTASSAATAAADPWASAATDASPSGVPAVDTGTGGGDDLPPGATDIGDVVQAAGEPVHGPSGLLAMIAAVLTVGVGVAAVRAILARRPGAARFA